MILFNLKLIKFINFNVHNIETRHKSVLVFLKSFTGQDQILYKNLCGLYFQLGDATQDGQNDNALCQCNFEPFIWGSV